MEEQITLEQIQDFKGKYPKQLWYLFFSEMWERFVPVLLKARGASHRPMCLIISGTIPETLRVAAGIIEKSACFRRRAHGVTPFFADAYAPCDYWIFDAI